MSFVGREQELAAIRANIAEKPPTGGYVTITGQEIIFVDGLDQSEEDASGVRDLSFLPVKPPEGIVFVLAPARTTRSSRSNS